MLNDKPGKDTREQARAELEQRARDALYHPCYECGGCRLCDDCGGSGQVFEPSFTAVVNFASAESARVRREGMEEAAGICDKLERRDDDDYPPEVPKQYVEHNAALKLAASTIRAAKEDDHG
jgi:hypothetical protein